MTKTLRLLSLAALLTTGIGDRDAGGQQRCDRDPADDGHPDRQPADGQARDGRYHHDAPGPVTPRNPQRRPRRAPNPAGILTRASSGRPVRLSRMRPIRTAPRRRRRRIAVAAGSSSAADAAHWVEGGGLRLAQPAIVFGAMRRRAAGCRRAAWRRAP